MDDERRILYKVAVRNDLRNDALNKVKDFKYPVVSENDTLEQMEMKLQESMDMIVSREDADQLERSMGFFNRHNDVFLRENPAVEAFLCAKEQLQKIKTIKKLKNNIPLLDEKLMFNVFNQNEYDLRALPNGTLPLIKYMLFKQSTLEQKIEKMAHNLETIANHIAYAPPEVIGSTGEGFNHAKSSFLEQTKK